MRLCDLIFETKAPLDRGCQMRVDELRRAASLLRASDRGTRVLDCLASTFIEGGNGLDATNKRAALKLFAAMLECPWDWPAELTHREKKR